jgi:DNA-directed RNA polymerase subunit omega
MTKIEIEDILNGKENKYSLVIAVAKRARQISRVTSENQEIILEKPVLLALEDFKNHKYNIMEPEYI